MGSLDVEVSTGLAGNAARGQVAIDGPDL